MNFKILGERRYGRFRLPEFMYTNPEYFAKLSQLMQEVIVLRCGPAVASDYIEYIAWHKHFRPLEDNEDIPEYYPYWGAYDVGFRLAAEVDE